MRHLLPLAFVALLPAVEPTLPPLPATVPGCAQAYISLGGTWDFRPRAEAPWAPIQVPGEWAMQGFTVAKDGATYRRTFTVPADWGNQQVRLRCRAVYAEAVVTVNGREVGRHVGGFTPFDFDVTSALIRGSDNRLEIAVRNDSPADRLASGSHYACHPLGGIPRDLGLYPVPAAHLTHLQIATDLTAEGRDAVLGLTLASSAPATVRWTLLDPTGTPLVITPAQADLGTSPTRIDVPVTTPATWDPERPRLHTLTLTVLQEGKPVETIVKRVGFRSVRVEGNRLLVNGRPVKLRGVNRHEIYPSMGRCLPPGMHRTDVEQFRAGNVNHLRTAHYPPDEALMEAADELGMWIECEAPFCWAVGTGNRDLVLSQTAEMVAAFRNHPSILFWSLANESKWGDDFAAAADLVKTMDPTRPSTFNWQPPKIQAEDEGHVDIATIHYPAKDGPRRAQTYGKRPVYLGEDCHLNAYNRIELATDQGIRGRWGKYLMSQWEDILTVEGCLGMSIWAGIDDTFFIDGKAYGYGTWGPLDGWRRPKPEYAAMQQAYAPVRIMGTPALSGSTVTLTVENRQNFADLAVLRLAWHLGQRHGEVTASAAPGQRGNLVIPLGAVPAPGEVLSLAWQDPRGFTALRQELVLVPAVPAAVATTAPTTMTDQGGVVTITSGTVRWTLDRATGQFTSLQGRPMQGPVLLLLPLNGNGDGSQMHGMAGSFAPDTSPCTGWTATAVDVQQDGPRVVATVAGRYDQAEGRYILTFQNGRLDAAYDFTTRIDLTKTAPRQIGMVFTLPHDYEVLTWERDTAGAVLPEDDIGRQRGTVRASDGFPATPAGPSTKPNHPWRLDRLPYGNNDFCSTKHEFMHATVTDAQGHGLAVDGQGRQHLRCWQTADAVHVLVADVSNAGGESFLRALSKADHLPLMVGARVSGSVRVTGSK